MPSLQTVVLFMASALALNLTPGPAIVFILSRCLGQGRTGRNRVGVWVATASVIHAVAAAFGTWTRLAQLASSIYRREEQQELRVQQVGQEALSVAPEERMTSL